VANCSSLRAAPVPDRSGRGGPRRRGPANRLGHRPAATGEDRSRFLLNCFFRARHTPPPRRRVALVRAAPRPNPTCSATFAAAPGIPLGNRARVSGLLQVREFLAAVGLMTVSPLSLPTDQAQPEVNPPSAAQVASIRIHGVNLTFIEGSRFSAAVSSERRRTPLMFPHTGPAFRPQALLSTCD